VCATLSQYTETHARSVAKAVSWRVLGTTATTAIVWLITRQPVVSMAIAGVDFLSKTGLYWLHERVWDRIRAGRRQARPVVIWLTGLSGAGKTTLAEWLLRELRRAGHEVEHLDGDTVRTIFPTTGYTRAERDAHIRRVGYLAAKLEQHGVVVLASFISPYSATRAFVRSLCTTFVEVYVATPIDECERRDVKGLYSKARRGEIECFTGVTDPYEAPTAAEIVVDTRNVSIEDAGDAVLRRIRALTRASHGSTARTRVSEHLYPSGGIRQLPTPWNALVDRQG
jgi:adenylylsulfate kinase